MFVYKVNHSRSHSEEKVNKFKLQTDIKNSFKKKEQVKRPTKSCGNSRFKKVTQVNKKFLEQLGFKLQK